MPLIPGAYAPRLAAITTSPYGVASAVPLVAGVRLTLQLPEEALSVEADNFLLEDLAKTLAPSFLRSSSPSSLASTGSGSLLTSFKATLPRLPSER